MSAKGIQRIIGMLGFARRAGATVIGTELICRALPKGAVKLVVVSCGASEATKKKLTVKSEFYGVEAIEAEVGTEELGRLLGKSGAVAAVAVCDGGFAGEILKAHRGSDF